MIKYQSLERILNQEVRQNAKVLELGSNGIPGYLDHRTDIDIIRTNIIKLKGIDKIVDATSLPFGNSQFDAVFMVATDYYVRDIDQMISEISRVLKPNGILINATYKTSNLRAQVRSQPSAIHALNWSEYLNLYSANHLSAHYKIILNNPPLGKTKRFFWSITPNILLYARSQWRVHIASKF